jgi:glyoxylase I family protein
MIRGVHHVSLHSPDLDRLRAFYQAAFGFRQVGEEMRLENYAAFDQITGVKGGELASL